MSKNKFLAICLVTISGAAIIAIDISSQHDLKNVTNSLQEKVHRYRRLEGKESILNRTARHLLGSHTSHRQEAECGYKCGDGTCIKSYMKCDGTVQCPDISDEIDCSCVDRIGSKKRCDGFEDCPMGEDEIGCGFGCEEDEFSCSDSKGVTQSLCIEISKRCDGHNDCPGQEDEADCFRFTSFDLSIRGILPGGALQKRIGGDWYSICKSTSRSESRWLKKYARKACEHIVGGLNEDPKTSLISTTTLNINPELLAIEPLVFAKLGETESQILPVTSCTSEKLYQVECPEPECGWPASKYDGRSIHRGQNPQHSRHQRHTPSKGLTAKIVGGYDSVHGNWPFLVGIYRNGTFHCGGSIVNKEYIITAAHCCHGYDKYVYEIQVGMTRRINSWSPHEQTRIVKEIHVHERYDSKIFLNDIALMKVDYPFFLSKWVTTACLATEKSQDPSEAKSCKVIGWGDLSESSDGPDHLQEVDLPILAKCQETFTKDSHQICAGVMEGGKDACQGDSGGPLICYDDEDRPYVNGLVSFGRGCARPNQAGVYTRVSAYKTWIETTVSGENPATKLHKKPKECPITTRCLRDGGECLFPKYFCDQKVECLGVDDEVSCKYVSRAAAEEDDEPGEEAYEHIRRTSHDTQEHTHEYGSAKLCGPTEFQCQTSLSCIPLELKCDGKKDCVDLTDEKQCECGEIIRNSFPSRKCDGVHNCLDGTDELDCERCNGTRGMVKCPFSDKCIREAHVCDGMAHCDFGEDEVDCIRITKTMGKIPEEGFLSDKLSRGLHSGFVILRSSGITWRLACVQDFGNNFKDIVCPYLGLAVPEHQVTRSARSAFLATNFAPRRTRDVDDCQQVKVQCGDLNCGESKLFSMSPNRPEADHIGALPWLIIVMVEGNPVCAGTLVHKQWLLVSSDCINENVRSTVNEYMSAVAGFSETTNVVASPMEQIRRVNAIVKPAPGVALLRLESAFMTDHFANPICTSVSSDLDRASCIRVSVVDGTDIKSWPVSVDPSCGSESVPCITGDCEETAGSFVYCTTDGTAWFLLGYVDSTKTCLGKDRIELINPFHGHQAVETKDVLTRPPSSLIKAPGCSGTRCTFGNCVGKSFVCDGIAHCPDNLDEKRCQRHYQVLRSRDDDEDTTPEHQTRTANESMECDVGHFRCITTGNCVPISAFCDGISDCGEDDLTDEPLNENDCSCRHYLELSAPERVCDAQGTEDCPDRSDEIGCSCRSDSFVCDVSSATPFECINMNLVCDSVKDCANGRDEEMCTAVSKSLTTVIIEARPIELEGYVLVRVKGSWHPYCTDQWSEDFALKLCNFLGYKNLNKIQTIALDELKFKHGVPLRGFESAGDQIGGQAALWILGQHDTAGPLEEAVQVANHPEEYQCELGYIRCT